MLHVEFVERGTDQQEGVFVDFPDQTGLFAVPPLYVHHLPVLYCDSRLQGAGTESDTTNREIQSALQFSYGFIITVKLQ